MTDDRLYPPAAEYLAGVLARSHRQPRVEGLEGYVWFDVPHQDGTTYMLPVPEDLLQPAIPPEPEPGAYLLDGIYYGFRSEADSRPWTVHAPAGVETHLEWAEVCRVYLVPHGKVVPLVPAQSTVDASVVAVQQPGGGAS